MGVRWPILALVGVGILRTKLGERFGTVVDGVEFLEVSDFENAFKQTRMFGKSLRPNT